MNNEANTQHGLDQTSPVRSTASVSRERPASTQSASDKSVKRTYRKPEKLDHRHTICGEPCRLRISKSNQYSVTTNSLIPTTPGQFATEINPTVPLAPMPPPILSIRRNNKVQRQMSEPIKYLQNSLPSLLHEKNARKSPFSQKSATWQSKQGSETFVGNRDMSPPTEKWRSESGSSEDYPEVSRKNTNGSKNGIYSRVDLSRRRWSEVRMRTCISLSDPKPLPPSKKPDLPLRCYNKLNLKDVPGRDQEAGNKSLIRKASNYEGFTMSSAGKRLRHVASASDSSAQAEKTRLALLGKKVKAENIQDGDMRNVHGASAGLKLQMDIAQLLACRAEQMQRALAKSNDDEIHVSRGMQSLKTVAIGGMIEDQSNTDYQTQSNNSRNVNSDSLKLKIPLEETVSKETTLAQVMSKAKDYHTTAHDDSFPTGLPPPLFTPSVQNLFAAVEEKRNNHSPLNMDQSLGHSAKFNGRHSYSSVATLENSISQKVTSPQPYPASQTSIVLLAPPPEFDDGESQAEMSRPQSRMLGRIHSVANVENHAVFGRPVITWSVDDVADWLGSVAGMGEQVANFVSHAVDGRMLSQLGRTELISLGVTHVGQRMNIERAVKRLIVTQNK